MISLHFLSLNNEIYHFREMRFGEYLRSNLTPEWSGQYISYEDMEEVLTDVINQIPSMNI